MTGKMSGMEKEMYWIPKFSGKQKDYYCWSWIFFSYAELRKYQYVLTGETPIPDIQDAAVKSENDLDIKANHADILRRLQKAKLELMTAVEKNFICFLRVSQYKNAREAWVSLKERYEPSTVAEEL